MRIIPKANTLRKGILLYRGIRYRKGFGVHSPFVFNLITKVIEERCQYYSFYDIELIRKQLLLRDHLSRPPAKGEDAPPHDRPDCRTRSDTAQARRLTFPSCQLFQIKTHPSVRPFHGPVHFVSDFICIRSVMYRSGKRTGVCLHRPYRFRQSRP